MKENWSFGERIRQLRKEKCLPIRKVAAFIDIDPSSYSKIERGERTLTKDCLVKLATLFEVPEKDLIVSFYSDRIAHELFRETNCEEILRVAERRINYLKASKSIQKEINF